MILDKKKEYRQSKRGVVNDIYNNQKSNSKSRGDIPPSYDFKELLDYTLKNDLFHVLYEQYKSSGFKKDLKPSYDRPDDYKGYSFDNIQLMTWEENNAKGRSDIKEGKNNKRNKTVLQLDLNGDLIKEWYSTAQVERELNINHRHISEVCNKKLRKGQSGKYFVAKTAGGFKWAYKEDNY